MGEKRLLNLIKILFFYVLGKDSLLMNVQIECAAAHTKPDIINCFKTLIRSSGFH